MMARGCYLLAVCMLAALFARAASVGSGGDCVVSFNQTSYTVDEGGMLQVMVTIDPICSIENDVIVNISSINGSAVGGNDFVEVSQMLNFTNSTRQIPVAVEILNDTVVENQEDFTLTLDTSDLIGVMLPNSSVEVFINDASSVTVEFDTTGYVVAEGGSVDVVLMVNGGTLERSVEVQMMVDNGATEGDDYTALPASVVLTAGTTSHTVTFTAANDSLVEGEEMVQLTLGSSDPTVVMVGLSSSVAIRDTTIATVSFSEPMYSVMEGNQLTFEVIVEPQVTLVREVEVTVTLMDGTAVAPGDYAPGPITVTLMGTGGTAMVDIVNDTLAEPDEEFDMILSSNDPAVSVGEDTAIVTIINPDLTFQFDQSTYFVNEGGSVPVTVTWADPQQGEVEVRVTVEAVTPSGTLDDYSISPENIPENITFSTASNTSVVVITARSDKMKEDPQDEDFTLSLESSFRLSVASATLTISDTTVTLNVVGDNEVTEGESITLNITTLGPFVENFLVKIQADPANEVVISQTYVNFTSTTTQGTVTIGGMVDGEPEENETVTIRFTTMSANVQDFDYSITVIDATVNHVEGPQSQGVAVNDSVTLTCRFEAGNPVVIVWMKDGVPLDEGGGSTLPEGGFGYNSTLIIDPVEFSNCGNYSCSVGNVSSPPAELGVYQLANTSDQNPTSSIGAVGVISCSIISCGQVSVVFDIDTDNATQISLNTTTTDVNETLSTVENTTEATITTLGLVHEGMSQSCNVTYGGVVLREEVFNYTLENVAINVDVRAENLTLPNRTGSDSFVVGDDVVLNCSATNPPDVDRDLTIRWFRLSYQLREEGMYVIPGSPPPANTRVETGDGYVALILPAIQDNSEVETIYICKAYNRLPRDQVDAAVNVTVISGPVVRFPRNVLTVNVGETQSVVCDTTGSDPDATNITVTVTRPGEDTATVDTTADATRPQFSITGNLSLNGSVYNCTAFNEIGPTPVSFTLVVRDVPGEVNSTTIASVPLTLLVSNVTWSAPISNNAEITNYTVTVCSTATDVCVNYTTPRPLAAVHTVPTVTYNVSVIATNVVGSSNSDTTTIVGTNQGAEPTVTGFALSPAFLILEWSLPSLVSNVTGAPNDLPAESVFSVDKFVISSEGVEIARIAEMSYLYRIPKDENNPADGSETMLPFVVEVVYSDINIKDNLNTTSFTSVAVPNVVTIAAINTEPRGDPITTSRGFTFRWAPPAQVENPEFIDLYNVVIDQLPEQSGRRKRQAATNVVNVNQTGTEFQFTTGEPFTDYTVRVYAVLDVNGDTTRVTALSPNTIMTGEEVPSAPLNPVVTDTGITTVRVMWEVPANPNGVISGYRVIVRLMGIPVMEETSVGSSTSLVITGLRGLTDYEAVVSAMNGAGEGPETRRVQFKTDFGVVPPIIRNVVANIDQRQYTFTTDRLSDQFGPLSHYEVYAVITDQPPDTSAILPEQTDTSNSYVTFAGQASSGLTPRITVGTGEVIAPNGQQVNYDNRFVRLGAKYFFFVRLYSSQDVTRFNDSQPVPPSVVIPIPQTAEEDPTVPIIASVLGALAIILILVLVTLLIFAFRGRISNSYKVPHLRRLEDGEKGGIELRRRTRHFTPVLDVGDPNVFTSVGQPTTLVCEVSGTPAPTIKWSHEGKPLDDERFLVLADHSLFVQNTSLEDEGSYLVTAENSTGTTSAQIKVTVIKPTPPEHDESHPPVPVDNFTEYFARMTANEGDDLEEEYQDVEPDFAHTAFAAKLSINRNKNRYINIIPYDHSRVVLALQENTPGSDYVNASYIDGYRRNNQYIATQGPTTTTLADFWRMVWELDCPTIIMVTKLEEEDKRKCEQYWPSYGSTTYGNVQVTLKEAENLAEYSIRTFSITPLAGQSSAQMPVREVKQFHFLKWPDHGVPNYATALLHFRKRVHLYHPLKRGPMIVHCSAGVGRTGTFATVDYCMERMEGEGIVDIFNFVQQMRYKRNYMVQTAPQYEFIHEAINEAIMCGDTSIKAPELKDWLAKLTPDPETGKTVLDDQFKRLETASPHDEEFDCTVAEVNKDKNRVNKHLPANDQRVVLSSENDQCDYICASYVDGYRQRNAFMITQGPMEDTVGDFWRMVWELKSAAIVMLTQLEENGEMSRKYWSDTVGEAAVFGLFHVELTSEVRDLGDYCTRKIKLSPISNPQETRIVTQFHFTKWTCSAPPESAKPMIDMIDELQRVQRKSGNQPITVHCNDGLGRTGTFCTLYYVLDRVKTEQVVDVFQAVKTLRIQRTGLVENLEQFQFVHTATMEFLNTFSDYQNFK